MRIRSLSGPASLFSLHMLSEGGCLVTVALETALLCALLIVSSSFRITLCAGFSENKLTTVYYSQNNVIHLNPRQLLLFHLAVRCICSAEPRCPLCHRHGTLNVREIHVSTNSVHVIDICSYIFKT